MIKMDIAHSGNCYAQHHSVWMALGYPFISVNNAL
jgi:hypothetical protein